MACYIVSFQAKELAVRQRLRELLKGYGTYCPINNTCWAIVTDKKAAEVRNHLITALKAGDRVFVVRSGTEAAWRGMPTAQQGDWLKKHL
jgi:hypothetical protein